MVFRWHFLHDEEFDWTVFGDVRIPQDQPTYAEAPVVELHGLVASRVHPVPHDEVRLAGRERLEPGKLLQVGDPRVADDVAHQPREPRIRERDPAPRRAAAPSPVSRLHSP